MPTLIITPSSNNYENKTFKELFSLFLNLQEVIIYELRQINTDNSLNTRNQKIIYPKHLDLIQMFNAFQVLNRNQNQIYYFKLKDFFQFIIELNRQTEIKLKYVLLPEASTHISNKNQTFTRTSPENSHISFRNICAASFQYYLSYELIDLIYQNNQPAISEILTYNKNNFYNYYIHLHINLNFVIKALGIGNAWLVDLINFINEIPNILYNTA